MSADTNHLFQIEGETKYSMSPRNTERNKAQYQRYIWEVEAILKPMPFTV